MSSGWHSLRGLRRFVGPLAATTLASLVFVGVGGWFSPSGGRDDMHITLWAAEALSRWGEILNINGERVEQSSSLAQVLLLAGVHRLTGVPLIALAHLLSLVSAVAAVVLVAFWGRSVCGDARGGAIAALLLATCPFFVYWAFGGLEATLVGALAVSWLSAMDVLLGRRGELQTWAGFAVLTWALLASRPEMPMVLACVFLALAVANGLSRDGSVPWAWGRLGAAALAGLGLTASLWAFRWLYFNSVWPQPVLAKVGGPPRIGPGVQYVWESLFSGPWLWLASLLCLLEIGSLAVMALRGARLPRGAMLCASYVLAYAGFVITSGGDWMEAGRFWVPLVPGALLLAIRAALRIESWVVRPYAPPWRRAVAPALVLLILAQHVAGLAHTFEGGSTSLRADVATATARRLRERPEYRGYSWFEYANRIHVRDMAIVHSVTETVRVLNAHGIDPVYVQSQQMGMVAYYVARELGAGVRFVDMKALVDDTFTNCSLTDGNPRSRFGLEIPMEWFFLNLSLLRRQCDIGAPHVLFDVNPPTTALRNGYVPVFLQRNSRPPPLRIKPLAWGLYVAVRRDLAQRVGGFETTHLDLADVLPHVAGLGPTP